MRSDSVLGSPPREIAIKAPNWVGDVVMATPLFRCVRSHFPTSRVRLLIRPSVADVVRRAPWFDGQILCRRTLSGLLAASKRLRELHADLGLILPNSFRSALMFWLGGVQKRVGYVRDLRGPLLTDGLARPSEGGRFKPTYMVDYYLSLCEAIGLTPQDRNTTLPLDQSELQGAERILLKAGVDRSRPLFLLHPAAGYGSSKLWALDNFSMLAAMLREEFGAQVACIGSREATPAAQRIDRGSRAKVIDLTNVGIDLHLLKGVISLSGLLVTTDSGPRHYGVALGIPTVCLMGPTHPDYSTSSRPHDHVLRVDVECAPCQRKVCPRDHRCMSAITPAMALESCRRALQARKQDQ